MRSGETQGGAFQIPSAENDIEIIANADEYYEVVGYGQHGKTKSNVVAAAVSSGEFPKPEVQCMGEQGRLRSFHDEQLASKIGMNRWRKQSRRVVSSLIKPTDSSQQSLQKPLRTGYPASEERAVSRERYIAQPQATTHCHTSFERRKPPHISPDSTEGSRAGFLKDAPILTSSFIEKQQKCEVRHPMKTAGTRSLAFGASLGSPPAAPTNLPAYSSDVGCKLTRRPDKETPSRAHSAFLRPASPTKRDRYPDMEVGASFSSSSPPGGLVQSIGASPPTGPPQRGRDDDRENQAKGSRSLWHRSRSEYVVDAKLEQQLFVLLGDDRTPTRWPERQRWVLANKSMDSMFTVEYTFEDPTGVVIFPCAVLTREGHCVVTVPSGERRLVAEGPPTRTSISVRTERRASSSEAGKRACEDGDARRIGDIVAATDQLMHELMKELGLLSETLQERRPRVLAALCRRRGVDYVDLAFPPLIASLGVYEDPAGRAPFVVRWVPAAAPLAVRPRPTALRVGPLGDYGVASALGTLAEAPWSLQRSLSDTTDEDEANGVCGVWLAQRGLWGVVSVDGYLPCVQEMRTGRLTPYGCSSAPVCDLWVLICEKALAKIVGSYSTLRRLEAAHAISSFTGGPVEVWDWWKKDSMRAFLEMDAVIRTSARGFGIVLLTAVDVSLRTSIVTPAEWRVAEEDEYAPGRAPVTSTNVRDVDIRNPSSDFDKVSNFFQRTGLKPGCTYHVLSVAENAKGELMALVRDWQRRPQCATSYTERIPCLSDYDRGSGTEDAKELEVAAMFEPDSSCSWLKFEDEVLKFFQWCHVCYDCRSFHDVRVVVPFKWSPVATPLFFFRVRILPVPHDNPARLWIGLHQPLDEILGKYDLKLTLIVEDDAWGEQDTRLQNIEPTLHASPSHSILTESYGGVYQSLPVVWMFMELRAHETMPFVFYVLPQIRQVNRGPLNNECGTGAKAGVDQSVNSLDATVAFLGDDRDSLEVELLHAPEGLATELSRSRLDRLNWSSCRPVSSSSLRNLERVGDAKGSLNAAEDIIRSTIGGPLSPRNSRFQIDGRWVSEFSW